MNNEPRKKNIIYSAEDIQKYLSGNLTPAEMHAMEKAALDDTFLAEAMEGYGGMQQQDWERPLAFLKDNFSTNETARVVPLKPASRFSRWKVAAAILIICGGLTIGYLFSNKYTLQNNSIATIGNTKDSIHKIATAPAIADTINKPADATNDIVLNEPKAAKSFVIPHSRQQILADSAFIYRPGRMEKHAEKQDAGGGYVGDTLKASDDIATTNALPSAKQNNLDQLKGYNATSSKNENFSVQNQAAPVLVLHKFAGQVVSPDGSPLPFANITVSKENVGTYADARGNFSLVSGDSLLNVEIKSAGFITRNFTLLTNMPQNTIMLAEDELALKEKTLVPGNIVSSAAGRKRAILIPDTVINVEPEDGWNNYDTYITNNLSLSNDIRQKKIHGEVEVSFDVQSDGALTNVKIDKSLCDDCDEAALKVVKDGPRWKIKRGSQSTGKVKVKF